MLFDTHAHYDDRKFDEDRDALLSSMPEHGISLILNPGCDPESSKKAVELSEKYPFMYAAVGTHPHEAEAATEEDMALYAELSKHEKVMAIGEIGLDYYYDMSPRDIQKKWLDRQLSLAGELSLPVIIHEREAAQDVFQAIKRHAPKVRGVYHCYSGSYEMAREIMKLGYYISFTGSITFANAHKLREVVKKVPLERIMIETDSPYLTPAPYRGRRNDSTRVHLVAEMIAELHGVTYETVAETAMKNGKELFGIK
ncbi:MAG: TatD family hydrolase [Clostridia bacterium]|jgi:TatD DNase family protein|nr:TatD family hydrolase [Clostridia bacterium]